MRKESASCFTRPLCCSSSVGCQDVPRRDEAEPEPEPDTLLLMRSFQAAMIALTEEAVCAGDEAEVEAGCGERKEGEKGAGQS